MTNQDYVRLVDDLQSKCMDFPSTLSIETMALCNADCSFCPYSSLERVGTVLSDEVIDKIVKEIAMFPENHPLTIVLARVNETMLDKRWYSIAEKLLCAKPNVRFGFFSNGTTITRKNLTKLHQLGAVDYLNVSLNYVDPEEHFHNMRIRFDQVIANLDELATMKRAREFGPLVVVSRVGTGDLRDQAFTDYVERRWPEFRVRVAPKSNWAGTMVVEEHFDVPATPCRQWFQLHILADGRQAFCCLDSDGRLVEGSIFDQSLLEMYNRPELRKIRQELPNRSAIAACSTCTLMP